jgi:hypothetical protein
MMVTGRSGQAACATPAVANTASAVPAINVFNEAFM